MQSSNITNNASDFKNATISCGLRQNDYIDLLLTTLAEFPGTYALKQIFFKFNFLK